jgi:hypothetical protein
MESKGERVLAVVWECVEGSPHSLLNGDGAEGFCSGSCRDCKGVFASALRDGEAISNAEWGEIEQALRALCVLNGRDEKTGQVKK